MRESTARKLRIGAPGTDKISCMASSTLTLRPSVMQRSRSSMMGTRTILSSNSRKKSKSSCNSSFTFARKPSWSLTIEASLKSTSPRLTLLSLLLAKASLNGGTMAATTATRPVMPTSAASIELTTLAWNSAITWVYSVASSTMNATKTSKTTTA